MCHVPQRLWATLSGMYQKVLLVMEASLSVMDCCNLSLRESASLSFLCGFIEHEGKRNSFQVLVLGRLSEISVLPRHKMKMAFFSAHNKYFNGINELYLGLHLRCHFKVKS